MIRMGIIKVSASESIISMVAAEICNKIFEDLFLIPIEEINDELMEQVKKDVEGVGFNYDVYPDIEDVIKDLR